jgi:hypothetical protein
MDTHKARYFVLVISLLTCIFSCPSTNADSIVKKVDLGVFYFPGWSDGEAGLVHPIPWEPIKSYPEREPLLGWYQDKDPKIIRQEISWMREFGINFVVFDWYWDRDHPFLDKPLENFLSSKDDLGFSIMWAIGNQSVVNLADFDRMVNYWIANYLMDPRYKLIRGEPVIYISSGAAFMDLADKLGVGSKKLLDRAREIIFTKTQKHVLFAGSGDGDSKFSRELPDNGFDFAFAYNYQSGPDGKIDNRRSLSHSYVELAEAYSEQWQWFRSNNIPYIHVASSGWDRKPWGGSSDSAHDNSNSTPAEFQNHLSLLKKDISDNPTSPDVAIICCWNEFGEGSYIAPTKSRGFAYLNAVKNIFLLK